MKAFSWMVEYAKLHVDKRNKRKLKIKKILKSE
jgi:hypothetical protein